MQIANEAKNNVMNIIANPINEKCPIQLEILLMPICSIILSSIYLKAP